VANNQRMIECLTDFKDYLTSGNAYLNKVNSIATDLSITLPGTATSRWAFLNTYFDKSRQYPSIMILPSRKTKERQYYPEPVVNKKFFEIDVFIMHKGSNPETLQNIVMCYVEAIVEMIEDDQTCGNRFLYINDNDIDYTDMIQSERQGEYLYTIPVHLLIEKTIH
jgi:hypothetical protein